MSTKNKVKTSLTENNPFVKLGYIKTFIVFFFVIFWVASFIDVPFNTVPLPLVISLIPALSCMAILRKFFDKQIKAAKNEYKAK